MKECTKCGKKKPLSEFHKAGFGSSGIRRYRGECKECIRPSDRKKAAKFRKDNPEYVWQWRDSKDDISLRGRLANIRYRISTVYDDYDIDNALVLDDLKEILLLSGGICPYCNEKFEDDYHFDHIIPISMGGSNTPDNVMVCCARCNQSKGGKVGNEFEKWKKDRLSGVNSLK